MSNSSEFHSSRNYFLKNPYFNKWVYSIFGLTEKEDQFQPYCSIWIEVVPLFFVSEQPGTTGTIFYQTNRAHLIFDLTEKEDQFQPHCSIWTSCSAFGMERSCSVVLCIGTTGNNWNKTPNLPLRHRNNYHTHVWEKTLGRRFGRPNRQACWLQCLFELDSSVLDCIFYG